MRVGGFWRARRRTIASATVIALVAGGTLTVAALHPGFPVSDVELSSRDVWVTNGEQLLGGRLNRQIDELTGSVTASTPNFDVLQNGDAVFLVDPDNARLESVDPATTSIMSSVELPRRAEVAYGGDVISVVSEGNLWALSAAGDLQLDTVSSPPLLELGAGGRAAVTTEGAILAISPADKTLYRLDSLADVPVESAFPRVGTAQVAAIGDRLVALDESTNELVLDDGTVHPLGAQRALHLQQSGAASDYAILATATGLLRVSLGSGDVEVLGAEGATETTDPDEVAQPVNVAGCAHGAWAAARLYMLACEGQQPGVQDIPQAASGGRLVFRVNRDIVVLNDTANGNAWVMSEDMRLVDNWDDVTPPEEEESEEIGDEVSALQSFEDTLAERTDVNRDPTAIEDDFGIRPGRTTILSVLDNDSDPDGDVLVISEHGQISEGTGRLDLIDGARALQFTPAPGFVGNIRFSYTVDDGRGGSATADVLARVVPDGVNELPLEVRRSAVSVEANQTVEYNVLANWRDPDGDDMYLLGAAPTSGDLVRFTPDGVITFTHQTSELGEKEVQFQVADGSGQVSTGTLVVKVEAAGSQKPVGTPDFDTAFVGEQLVLSPLVNDISPSGAPLAITGIQEPGGEASATLDTDKNEVRFSASAPGVHYFEYTLAAGALSSVGIIRIDVLPVPEDRTLPPIAVKDTAYLRGDEPTTIAVLTNDVSPTGQILAVQSVDVPSDVVAKGVVVELLESTLIRVTSPQALTGQVSFTYTISDGAGTATAGVTVVPVPALTKHQPPVARDDQVTVRAGDIVTVDALANDYHPDDARMFLADELVTAPAAGIAFVGGDRVRFQAPTEPGEYRADYRVLDGFGETAAASVIFRVTPLDEASNRDPAPLPVVARVLSGGSIRIDLPLDRIDPDGDSTQLLRLPTGPSLGTIDEIGADFIRYTSATGLSGTDTFSYQVYDTFGATGVAEIKVAVIPPPDSLSNPNAVPDSVSVRPGRIAQVDLRANDSDPQGLPIKVEPELLDVPEGIEAEVVGGQYLVLAAPETERSFSLRYTLTNDAGGSDVTYVLIQVTPDAPLLPPSAKDIYVSLKEIAGKSSATVDIFDGHAFNPSGPNAALEIALDGPNAASGEVVVERHGSITVTPGEQRQAIAYRVTNADDGLTAAAFILVPAAVDEAFDDPPYIDRDLPIQYVPMNEAREWKLSDIVKVPSGRSAWIPEASSVSSVQSNGSSSYVDKDTIRFQGALDYRGPASITFTVTDGASKDDPKGNTTQLTLPIVVGDPEFRDTPPTFTSPSLQVEVGESTTFDLRGATGHPNAQILQQVTYSELTGTGPRLDASLSGSELTVSTPRNTPKGSTFQLGVLLRWDKFSVLGTIEVTVVGSTRAPAVAVADSYETQRGDGAVVASPLVNDSNPYESTGERLRIVDATVQNTGEPATISHTDDTVRILPNSSLKSGTIVVVYTIEDATEDPDRRTSGTITVVVSDVPDQVQRPMVPTQGDEGQVAIGFIAPASNGKPITGYEVRTSPSVATPTTCQPPGCTISGLTNGTAYTFSVRAINKHGPGEWSPASNPVIPYGTPGTPTVTIGVSDQWAPNAVISASWAGVNANGGSVSYRWRLNGGGWNATTATSTGNQTVGAGAHTFEVQAVNSGGKQGAIGAASRSITAQAVPPTPTLSVSVTKSEALGAIVWNWSAVSAAQGGSANLRYEINTGTGWTDVGTSTSHTRTGLSAGSYDLRVRAANKAGASAESAPRSGTITNPPAPPSISIVGTRHQAVDGCPSGCYQANVRFDNISSGSYTIYMEWTSGWTGNGQTESVSSGSTVWTRSATGTLNQGVSMRIRAVGPSGTLTTPWYTRAEWNAMK
ncbi:Ig-like domain-containing protein [Salinibacterium sp. ZJ77]|uniref:Ig-like domain-containing protein n=1 Tax=Salinibacterium sp. ZJ77 TaxID=2708337 RepID=UPI00141E9257|nr:Ig-like domain-containing protein [Salinibacterium sp. ZJ77]